MKINKPLVVAALVGGLCMACSKSDAEEGSQGGGASASEDLPSPEEAGLKTPAEAAAEAESISPEEADEALNALESEIGQG